MTAVATEKIDVDDRLAPRAAASYRRAIAAGMPAGDVTSAFRTRAEQQRLYELYKAKKGPVASKPGTSKHELGLALDLSNDKDDEGSARWWMQKHGEAFGWVRTNDEPWHFEYQAPKDAKGRAAAAAAKRRAAREKVKKIQQILGVARDGDPGTKTNAALAALFKAAK